MSEPACTAHLKPTVLFALEQELGHATHGRNLERVALARRDVITTVVRVRQSTPPVVRRVPLVGSWSVQASWQARTAVGRTLSRRHIDALYMHTQVMSLFSAAFLRQIPSVVSMDATPMNYDEVGSYYGHRRQSPALEHLKWHLNRRSFLSSRALVTWSHWAARSLADDYGVSPAKIRVIRPGVDLTRFTPHPRRRRGVVRLLFVGGDFERKGGRDLLEALRTIDAPLELDIVTSSAVDAARGDQRVHVHREVRHDSDVLTQLYHSADIFVLPSRSECFGIATSEALASGLPVIACDVGAVSEMVVHGANGYLVRPSSPRDLAEAIRSLVNREDVRASMGAKSLLLARREHDAEANNQSIVDLLRALAEGSNSPS